MSGPLATCSQCGSPLRANAPFCGACGQTVSRRERHVSAAPAPPPPSRQAPRQLVAAGRDVRCASFLLDMAAMLSPALPLATAAALLDVAEIVYIVVPVAFVAVWIWMQIWQVHRHVVRQVHAGAADGQRCRPLGAGVWATLRRGRVFAATLGFAALPALRSLRPTGCTTGSAVSRSSTCARCESAWAKPTSGTAPVSTAGRGLKRFSRHFQSISQARLVQVKFIFCRADGTRPRSRSPPMPPRRWPNWRRRWHMRTRTPGRPVG